MPTKVVNIYKDKTYDVYIGRAGKGQDGYFGNPIRLGGVCPECNQTHNDNGSTVRCYEKYFYRRLAKDSEFKKRIIALQNKTLACFCKPKACHGDVIKAYLDSLGNRCCVCHISYVDTESGFDTCTSCMEA